MGFPQQCIFTLRYQTREAEKLNVCNKHYGFIWWPNISAEYVETMDSRGTWRQKMRFGALPGSQSAPRWSCLPHSLLSPVEHKTPLAVPGLLWMWCILAASTASGLHVSSTKRHQQLRVLTLCWEAIGWIVCEDWNVSIYGENGNFPSPWGLMLFEITSLEELQDGQSWKTRILGQHAAKQIAERIELLC